MTHETKSASDWQIFRNQLEAKKAELYTQIGNYPTPITGCDEQFNHLLEEQRQVIQQLAKLEQTHQ